MKLATFERLAESLGENLGDGRIVVLRGQASSGRSAVVQAVVDRLGREGPVVTASGRAVPAVLTRALDDFEEVLATGSPAAIVVDDFGSALTTPHGVAFQNRLTSVAVDGEHALEAGVLLIARQNEALTRFAVAGAGSPIAGAAQVNFDMPLLTRAEVANALLADGCDQAEASSLVDRYGAHLGLIKLARARTPRVSDHEAVEAAIVAAVSGIVGGTANRILELSRRPQRAFAETLADQLLAPAVYQPQIGVTRLVPVFGQRGIADLLVDGTTSWPTSLDASVRRFRSRLYGLAPAIWADRYHGTHLNALSDFFDRLSATPLDVDLLMLGSDTGVATLPARVRTRFERRLAQWASSGLRIEWRLVAQQDYNVIHQRMLLAPNVLGGYVVPPSDRITGVHIGTDSDAILDPAPVNVVTQAWARATPFARH